MRSSEGLGACERVRAWEHEAACKLLRGLHSGVQALLTLHVADIAELCTIQELNVRQEGQDQARGHCWKELRRKVRVREERAFVLFTGTSIAVEPQGLRSLYQRDTSSAADDGCAQTQGVHALS